MKNTSGWVSIGGLGLGVAAVVWAHTSMGGRLEMFFQLEAAVVVFGGTFAALVVSFPTRSLRATFDGLVELMTRSPLPLETLVPAFMGFARKVRRQGLMAVETDAERTEDAFLSRALTLSASGMAPDVVREALDLEARVWAEREEERAHVLEAAAGYTPTLGIIGAVLGLMRAMQQFSTASIGDGIAAAFVATVYGVGTANLVLLPLATRLRGRARIEALRRDLVIDGVLALRDGASPAVVEERLAGYLPQSRETLAGAA